jgi:hypothetical protein
MTRITLARGTAGSAIILLSGALLLSACSGGTASSAGVASGQPAPAAVAPRAAAMQNGTAAHSGSAATQTAHLAPISQSIIYTASVTLRSASAAVTARRATGIVTAAGGYISAENAMAGSRGRPGTVHLTLKVPVAVYQQVLAELSAPSLGQQLALTQQAANVTEQVANVGSLVTSQEAAITALQRLLDHAASVSQLLQVQQQISTDESELESLQAQQRALDHETSYATISMTLQSKRHRTAAAGREHHSGFLAGLGAGWRALRHTTTAVLAALGAALPFLVVILVLGGLGYEGRRRFTRRRADRPAAG